MAVEEIRNRSYPWDIVLVVIAISSIGILLIASATNNKPQLEGMWQKQALVLCIGLAGMFLISKINYRFLLKISMPLYIAAVLSLVAVIIYGRVGGGARSWISVAGFSLQPSEFTKVILVLLIAHIIASQEKGTLGIEDVFKPVLLLAVPVALTALQPDLGTAITMVPLLIGILLVAGLRIRSIIAIVLIGLLLLGFTWMFLLKDYQKERIWSFFNPQDDLKESGYQIQQSRIAIGSGGLFGKGLFLGSQSQLNFVPAQHTDFIFSVLGEELGFFSVVLVLLMFGYLFTRPLLAMHSIHDPAAIFIVTGVISYLSFQTVINVLMSIGLFPTTGVPLPFLSAGGSALLTNLAAVGLILNVFANSDRQQAE